MSGLDPRIVGIADAVARRDGGDQHLGIRVDRRVLGAPIARVRDEGPNRFVMPRGGQVLGAGRDHGDELGGVVGGVGHLGGHDDVVKGCGGLRVVTLHEPVPGPQHPTVGIRDVGVAVLGVASRLGRLAAGKLATGRGFFAGPLGQIGLPVRRPLRVELAQRLSQPGPSVSTIRPALGQLVASPVSEALVLRRVGRVRLSQDLRGDLASSATRERGRVRLHFGPVDGHHPRRHEPLDDTQTQHLGEQLGDRRLVTAAKPSQRRMIRTLIPGQHPECHVLDQASLDPATRTLTHAIRVDQHPQHHRRVIARTAPAVVAQIRIEPREIQLTDHVEHEPGQMIRRQPLRHRGRHQEHLVPIDLTNIDRHAPSSPADQNAGGMVKIRATASSEQITSL